MQQGRKKTAEVADIGVKARERIDAYLRGECDVETLGPAMSALCKLAPDAAWEVLAVLDQYYRRNELTEVLFQSLKATVNRIAFRLPETAEPSKSPELREREVSHERTSTPPRPANDKPPPQKTVTSTNDTQIRKDREPSIHSSEPEPQPQSVTAAPVTEQARALAPGEVLRDRYVIERLVAYSRSTAVYKAYDRHRSNFVSNGSHVAIKVLHSWASAGTLAKFEQEFQLAQRLSHPNIVNVFDLDRDQNQHFFTMEWIEGQIVSSALKAAPANTEQWMDVIRQVGNGLVYLHENNVVHNGIRSENLILNDSGVLKILDFGCATGLAHEPWISSGESDGVDASAYASCEYMEGMPADKRDDVFSLACVSYELLSGEHPFLRQFAPRARDAGQRPRRIRSLKGRQWRTLRQGLAWSRNQRTASVPEWLAGMGIEARPQLAPADSAKAGKRSLSTAWLIAAIVIVGAFLFSNLEVDLSSAPAWLTATQKQVQQFSARTLAALESLVTERKTVTTPPPTSSSPAEPPDRSDPIGTSVNDAGNNSTNPAQDFIENPQAADTTRDSPGSTTSEYRSEKDSRSANAQGPASISFTADTFIIRRAEKAAEITVRRSGGNTRAATFVWWTEPGTAKSGVDYISLGRKTEQIPDGERSLTIFVPVVSGSQKRNGDIFFVEIMPSGNLLPGRITRAQVVLAAD